ncbi:MAG: SUMF1/EgtB/PvdO family nonheme iron enzyme [Chloroflexi bacterium]|nr:SUMF1/EgtB/PvdO family nonheme iron enzyme [Chloroflexota bacterium]
MTQAEQEDTWQQKYTQALGAIETGNQETAQTLLAEIIAQRPDYKETARYLLLATKEVDAEILTDNNREQAAQLEMLTKEKEALEQQNEQLQAQVAKSESRRRLLAVGLTFLLVGLLLGSGMGWGARTTFGPLPTAVAVTITPTAPASVSTETIVTNTPSPTATPGTFAPPVVATLGMTWTRPTDSMAMVFVPGGTFTMGSGSGDADATDDEKPAHDVTLDPFWIDRTEVTNTQFAAFLNEMGNREEGGVTWLDSADEDVRIEDVDGTFQPQDGFADHPVVEVSWYGARAYCEWAGGDVISGTLPTEAQWEYTARGVDGFIYPWGDEFDATLVNYSGNSDFARTSPVGHFPDGASWVGALDMAGNVWEWTADWYDANYYDSSPEENPPGLEDGTFKVLRGGGWVSDQSFVRAASRGGDNPDGTFIHFGFRCVVPPG